MIKKLENLRIEARRQGFGEGGSGHEKRAFYQRYLLTHRDIKRIGEIGFNAGFSSYAFLSTREDIEVQSFDIAKHPYVDKAFEILYNEFGERIKLKKADSLASVPNYKGTKFDMILVDGGHDFKTAYWDIMNMKKHSHKSTVIFVDDYGGELTHEIQVTGAVLTLEYLGKIKIVRDHRELRLVQIAYL